MISFREFLAEAARKKSSGNIADRVTIKNVGTYGTKSEYAAYIGNKEVAAVSLHSKSSEMGVRPGYSVHQMQTHPDFRGRGLMRLMHDHIEKDLGEPIQPSRALTKDGKAFWQRYRPEALKGTIHEGWASSWKKAGEDPKVRKTGLEGHHSGRSLGQDHRCRGHGWRPPGHAGRP